MIDPRIRAFLVLVTPVQKFECEVFNVPMDGTQFTIDVGSAPTPLVIAGLYVELRLDSKLIATQRVNVDAVDWQHVAKGGHLKIVTSINFT